VHDELVLECDAEDADRARKWLAEAMKQGMQLVVSHVPIEAAAVVVADWSGTPAALPVLAAGSGAGSGVVIAHSPGCLCDGCIDREAFGG
jgi:hypothetical protein